MAQNKKTDKKIKADILVTCLQNAAFDGWNDAVLQNSGDMAGYGSDQIAHLFPQGLKSVIEELALWADDQMYDTLPDDFETLKVREKIYTLVKTRLEVFAPHKEAILALVKYLARPDNALTAPQAIWRTADQMWHIAGDTATDFNHYSKRALLSGVLVATTLFWLKDKSENHERSWVFLENRINTVLKVGGFFGKIGSKIKEKLA